MTGTWWIGLSLNSVIGTAFVVIGLMLGEQLTRKGQWGTNRIGAVFTALVFTCGVGHLTRAILLAGPTFGLFGTAGVASRVAFADWHVWVADGVTAMAGVFYVIARTRDKDLLQTTRAFEDFRSRRERAIRIHDGVVQELAQAKIALEAGHHDEAEAALQKGLQASKRITSSVHRPGNDSHVEHAKEGVGSGG